ncbi:MAG: sugar phosphate isomerase [Acidimicrobiaceae bacterium]|nr:sugar phosphate isomerase [Acidimicrobiaceae bacterium]
MPVSSSRELGDIQLGVDSFSFHRFFGEANRWESPLQERWASSDLLAYVEELGVEVVSLQSIHVEDLSPAGIEWLRSELRRIGVECIYAWGHRNGLEDGRNPEKLGQAIAAMRVAASLGCRIVRVVCGDQDSWSDDRSVRGAQLERLREPIQAICREAERLGVVAAVENHADRPVRDLLDLVASIESESLGVCLDVGNAVRVGDDPVASIEAASPFIVMTHLRDLRIDEWARGQGPDGWWPCVALGDGDLDIPGILGALAHAPRCRAWLVEASNVWPGQSELEIVNSSLGYLRTWLGGCDPVPS